MKPKTFAELEEMETVRRDVNKIGRRVKEEIESCLKVPELLGGRTAPVLAARYEWDHQAEHHCYWNNRFVLAVVCGLELHSLRLAAWCLVSNGVNGYFEWKTHSGYDMTVAFDTLGIDTSRVVKKEGTGSGIYCELDGAMCGILADMFNLPTTLVGTKLSLTDEEKREADRFDKKYPYRSVL